MFKLTYIVILCLIATYVQSRPLSNNMRQDDPVQSAQDAMHFLADFGYIDKELDGMLSADSRVGHEMIREYQHMAGLRETGFLDSQTVKTMNKPRCGNPDIVESAENGVRSRRRRRDTEKTPFFGEPWPRKTLTWRILKHSNSSDLKERESDVNLIMYQALQQWARVSGLVFRKAKHGLTPDLKVGFHDMTGDDGFEDKQTLAHADRPLPDDGSEVHFREEVQWSLKTKGKVTGGESLFAVAIHEFGHSLGLNHIADRKSIMHESADDIFELNDKDIKHIQELYGKPRKFKASQKPKPVKHPNVVSTDDYEPDYE